MCFVTIAIAKFGKLTVLFEICRREKKNISIVFSTCGNKKNLLVSLGYNGKNSWLMFLCTWDLRVFSSVGIKNLSTFFVNRFDISQFSQIMNLP